MQEQDLDLACPICSSEGTVKMIAHVTEIPISESILRYSFASKVWLEASRFHSSGGKNQKWSLSVKSQADLSSRVVRSSSCTVRIPELDLESESCSSSTYMYQISKVSLTDSSR